MAALLALGVGLLAGRALLSPGFYDSHDGLLNLHRLFELSKCLADGQIPCRWAPDMGYGLGSPVFNFYPPLPTYGAAALHALSGSFLDAVKLSFLISFGAAALGMFGLARCFYGPAAAMAVSVLYVWAPYRAVDVFVRGALGEAWGLALLPFVFWTATRTLRGGAGSGSAWRWALGCALAWAALLGTHTLVALMAAPVYVLWCGHELLRAERRASALPVFVAAHGLALALCASYLLPAIFEQRHAHTGTLTTLYPWTMWENNFLFANEVWSFEADWGYGAFRTPGGMSLFAGALHWGLALAAALWAAVHAARSSGSAPPRIDRATGACLLLAVAGFGAAWLTLASSRVVWEALPPLALLQFPWRFLGIASFGFAFAAGWAIDRVRPVDAGRGVARAALAWMAAAFVVFIAVASGWDWFRPSAMHVVADEVLANEREVARARHGLFDFMPAGVDLERYPEEPPAAPPALAEVVSGEARIERSRRESGRIDLEIDASAAVLLRLGVHDFPGWTLYVDDVNVATARADDPLARLHVEVPPGRHRVSAVFERTGLRAVADAISLAALAALLAWAVLAFRGVRRSASGRDAAAAEG